MTQQPRKNPLKDDALTADTLRIGDRIICWKPGIKDSREDYTILSEVYPDESEGGTLVVLVKKADDKQSVVNADEVGLTANRYTGRWSVIAIRNDEGDW